MLWVFLGILFICIVIGVPIAFALGLAAIVMMFIAGVSPAVMVEQAINGVNSFPLLAIPFFMLVGEIMSTGGIARRLVNFAEALVGFIAGGLGQVTVAASMFFGGISGSAVADTSAIGGMLIPSMKEQGYTAAHATAIVTSSSVIGIIIPPSIPMILYGIVTETSISRLFIAGLIPGLVIGLALMVTTFLTARTSHAGKTTRFSLARLWQTFKEASLGLILPVIIVGGILGGVFTATEAAVAALFYSLAISLFVYREVKVRDLWGMLINTGRLTGMVLFLLATATVVAWFLTTSMVPQTLVQSMTGITTNPYWILLMLSALLLLVGVVMDLTPAMVILAPIMLPIIQAGGIDSVYFGVLMSYLLGIGLLTPPVGTVLYVGCGIGKVRMEQLVRALLPFYGTLLVVLALLIMFPMLILWLPYASGFAIK
ncbi:TRAP transporter large permease [Skermanella mucosa]|uniref:TRAP transporter large permease n=1 Tax=Skermanella mucosa TaxID=1789672 RepID=UPI00192CDDC4|nr:TRAP transporter large permease [Skermanella mucosa]UEM18587.1 TRAP transporter large permease [Skermanella mucosa]